MLTIEKLRDFGAGVDEGLGRCLNNEAFYLRMVGMLTQDGNFDKLQGALAQGDLGTAFTAVHALKGTVGNLSLTPMYKDVCELTELLRSRSPGDYDALLRRILAGRDALRALAEE